MCDANNIGNTLRVVSGGNMVDTGVAEISEEKNSISNDILTDNFETIAGAKGDRAVSVVHLRRYLRVKNLMILFSVNPRG